MLDDRLDEAADLSRERLQQPVEEPDGEITFHLELNNVTLHFFDEEWRELMELIKNLK